MRALFLFLAIIFTAVSIAGISLVNSFVAEATTVAAANTNATTTNPFALQEQIDANNQQIAALNQEIAADQAALQQIGADKKTLKAAINALNLKRKKIQAQVAVTQHQISITQIQIKQLGGEIVDAEQIITADQAALGEEFRNLQQENSQSFLMQILSSKNISEAWNNMNAMLQLQDTIQNKIQTLQNHKDNLASSKASSQQKQQSLSSQQQLLTSQQQSLTQTEQSKNQLLAETNAKESIYQKLLAEAEAQLRSFSAFTQNAGGSGILGSETVCDTWGCYYNQRDAAWGNDSLNGTQFKLASDGCLITSMAMVMTHYGYKNVTPVTINSNPDNFAPYYPAMLLYTINVDGVSATRKTATIDSTLTNGNPVIVGLHAYGGTHFVVLTSGRAGNYIMRDPYIENGNNIPFSDHYSMRNIFGISKVVIN